MSRKLRRCLSLALVLVLALPSLGLAEEIEAPVKEVDYLLGDEEASEVQVFSLSDAEETLAVVPELELEPAAVELSDVDLTAEDGDAYVQSVELEGLRITLEPNGADAVPVVESVSDAFIAEASQAALGLEGEADHRLFHIALQDAAGDERPFDADEGFALKVEGLDLSNGQMAWVTLWDDVAGVCRAIEAVTEECVLRFTYAGPAIYDIVTTVAPAEAPTEVEQETALPVTVRFETEPAEATVELFADGPVLPEAEGGYLLLPGEYYYKVSAEGYEVFEGMFTVEDAPLTITAVLNETAEAAVVEPVAVRFETEPAEATVEVFADGPVLPEEEGGYLLLPGEYYYKVSAEGYETSEGIITVANEHMTVSVALNESAEGAEPVSVRFETEPVDATVEVFAEAGQKPILPEAEVSYLLVPGEYRYFVSAEGYETYEGASPSRVTPDHLRCAGNTYRVVGAGGSDDGCRAW